jgi:chromosomal replication initiation ATPase DnaA
MTLSTSVSTSLNEASGALRNALAYAARQERPVVCAEIAELLKKLEQIEKFDDILDTLDSLRPDESC